MDEIQKMHFQPINQILLKYDRKSKEQMLITCSNDKKVKVWDWMNKQLIHTLSKHQKEVLSICLTNDQSYLFSGSQDLKVIAWHTSNFKAIFTLDFQHSISSLRVTSDDKFLVAKGLCSKAPFLYSQILGQNLESTRIKISQKAYENIDIIITKNNKFIFILDADNSCIEIWNVDSKVLVKNLPTKSKNAGLTCSSDSKYLFHVTGDKEITQYDLEAAKDVQKYKHSHVKMITSLALNMTNKTLVSCCYGGKYCIYDIPKKLDENSVIDSSELQGEAFRYWLTIFMHGKEGKTKALALDNNKPRSKSRFVKIIDVVSKSVLKSIEVMSEINSISDLAITIDNKRIICGG